MSFGSNEPLHWHLVIVGPDEQGTLKRLKGQVARLGQEGSVTFSEALYGEEKAMAMASADVFVLPTRSENFGIVVAEALACGVPVITTKGAPWSELLGSPSDVGVKAVGRNVSSSFATCGRCGWWVDISAEALAEALKEAMGLTDEERRRMGENGRKLVAEKYQWTEIARKMAAVYEGLQRGGE